MPLRIGFDLDGTVADFAGAFREAEVRLFGPGTPVRAGEPEKEEQLQSHTRIEREPKDEEEDDAAQERLVGAREARRRRDLIWQVLQSTPNFWETLKPMDPRAVARIHALMLAQRWEVFFITQRPNTEGDTVQRQSQRWLVAQGFDLPSVLVLGGSRGAAAGAMRLDYHVDDSPQNCLDVLSESRAKPILITDDDDGATIASARKLGIGTAPSISEALDVLEQASVARTQPGLLARLATIVGWK